MQENLEQEAREQVKADSDVVTLTDKVLLFCEKIADRNLYGYQKQFAWRVVYSLIANDGDEITALFSRQSGKSETLSVLGIGIPIILPILAKFIPQLDKFKGGVWIGIFAPIREQGATTYDRVQAKFETDLAKEIMSDSEIDEDADTTGGIIRLKSRSLIRMMSASKQTKIESKTYHLILIEESQDVPDSKVQISIHPMGAAVNATIVKVGTPGIHKGDFYNAIQRNKRKDIKKKKNMRCHYEFDYKVCMKENPNYRKYIAKEIERYGEDADSFRMSYKLEWLLERGMFVTQSTFDDCVDKNLQTVVEKPADSLVVAGIDFGKSSDGTVLTVLKLGKEPLNEQGDTKKTILNWLEIEGDDYEAQFGRIVEYIKQFGVSVLLCDATGVGDVMVDRLKYELTECIVAPMVFSVSSKDKMYKYLHQEMAAKRIAVPGHAKATRLTKWKKFQQQMMDLEKRYSGRFMVCAHPDVKDAHDDYPDSLALACWAAKEEIMPDVDQCDGAQMFRGQSIVQEAR